MTLIVDAGPAAALVDSGPDGVWAAQLLATTDLAAPHLMPVEVGAVIRRAAMNGEVSQDTAAMAHADLLDLPVELSSYELFASRVWELRDTVTTHDGWYVALAESLGSELATLDLRLSRAPGPKCEFLTPPEQSSP